MTKMEYLTLPDKTPDKREALFDLGHVDIVTPKSGEMWVLIRRYGESRDNEDRVTETWMKHEFVIQKNNQLFIPNKERTPLNLAEGTYTKCYNWSNNYEGAKSEKGIDLLEPRMKNREAPVEGLNPCDRGLAWTEEKNEAGWLRVEYANLKWGTEKKKGDGLMIYRIKDGDEVVETGAAKMREVGAGKYKYFRADGSQITEDFEGVEIKEPKKQYDEGELSAWLDPKIMSGTLDLRKDNIENMWKKYEINGFWESEKEEKKGAAPKSKTPVNVTAPNPVSELTKKESKKPVVKKGFGTTVHNVKITYYYTPTWDEKRFEGDEEKLKDAGETNGSYKDANDQYKNAQHEKIDRPLTYTETIPRKDKTFAVPKEWRDKYIVIEQYGKVLTYGKGEDAGGAFDPGSNKIDVYTGEGEDAFYYGRGKYRGKGTLHIFKTQAEMDAYLTSRKTVKASQHGTHL